MNISNLGGLIKLNKQSGVAKIGSKTYSVGDIIEGKLVQIENTPAILLKDGKTLRIQSMLNQSLNLGDNIKIEIIKDMGVLVAKLVDGSVDTENLKMDRMTQKALLEIGMDSTDENKHVAKLLRVNDIPITRQNMSNIMEAKKHINTLINLINDESVDIKNVSIDKNIKTVLVEHFAKGFTTVLEGNSLKELVESEIALKDLKLYSSSKLQTDPLNIKNDLENKETIKHLIESDKNIEFNYKKSENAQLKTSDVDVKQIQYKNLATEKLNLIEFKSLVFNQKNNFENNIKNLVFLDKILLEEDTLASQIKRFSENVDFIIKKNGLDINKNPEIIKLFSDFQNLSLNDDKEFEELSKKLILKFDNDINLNSTEKSILMSQLHTIKNSMSYVNYINQDMAFVQIPMNINDNVENMSLYVKKKANESKIDPKRCNIFLSLGTKNCGEVKSMIEITPNSTNITFKLLDDEDVEYFKNHIEELKQRLAEFGYSNLIINSIKYEDNSSRFFDEDDDMVISKHILDVKL